MDFKGRFLGAIIGCAVGDALGAPFEGRSRNFMLSQKDLASQYKKIPGYPLGQYTDDTQMTLALSESIIARRAVDGADIATKFANLWRSNTIIGDGSSCKDAMMRIIVNDAKWDESGSEVGRAGNGTAMRASPIGLFHSWRDKNDLSPLKNDAITQSIITHRDERATAGAVAVSSAIYYCINNNDINPISFLDFIIAMILDISREFTRALDDLKNIINDDDDIAFKKISAYGRDKSAPPAGITPFVIPTVLCALYHFLKSPRDWKKSVAGALRFGGDTDTVASIAGAISGSYSGIESIPANLVEELKDAIYIQGIAMKLCEVAAER